MRRRHSQGPRRDPIHEAAPESPFHRLIVRLSPAVAVAGRAPSRFPHHLQAAMSPPARCAVAAWGMLAARPRLVRGGLIAIVVALAILGSLLAMVAGALMRQTPGWWRTMPPSSITEVTGNRVQNELTTLITSARPLNDDGCSVAWGMAINSEQANAWLNTKLRDWVRSRGVANESYEPDLPASAEADGAGPEAWIDLVREVQVDFNGDRIAIGARILHDGAERIFSATLIPQVREDGSLWMLAQNVQIGRLSVPASWVLPGPASTAANEARIVPASQSEEDVDLTRLPEVQVMFDAFSGRQPMIDTPLLRLPDGRRVRLLSLTTRDDGMLIVTCRTERP